MFHKHRILHQDLGYLRKCASMRRPRKKSKKIKKNQGFHKNFKGRKSAMAGLARRSNALTDSPHMNKSTDTPYPIPQDGL